LAETPEGQDIIHSEKGGSWGWGLIVWRLKTRKGKKKRGDLSASVTNRSRLSFKKNTVTQGILTNSTKSNNAMQS